MRSLLTILLITICSNAIAQKSVLYPQLFAKKTTNGLTVKRFDILCEDNFMIQNLLMLGKNIEVKFEDFEGLSKNENGEITPNISVLMTSNGDTMLWWPAMYENPNSYDPDFLQSLKAKISFDSIPEGYDLIEAVYTLYDHNHPEIYNSISFELNNSSFNRDIDYELITSEEKYTYESDNGVRVFSTKPFNYPTFSMENQKAEKILNLNLQLQNPEDTQYFSNLDKIFIISSFDNLDLFMDDEKCIKELTNGSYNFQINLGKKAELPNEVIFYFDAFEKGEIICVVVDISK